MGFSIKPIGAPSKVSMTRRTAPPLPVPPLDPARGRV